MRRRFLRFAVPLVLVGMVAAACSNNNDNVGLGVPVGLRLRRGHARRTSRSGLALDVGGLGDKSFNDAGVPGAAEGDRRRPRLRGEHEADRGQRRGHQPRRERPGARRRRLQPRDRDRFRVHARASTDRGGLSRTPDFGIIDGYATCGTACGLPNDAKASRTSRTSPSRSRKAPTWSASRRR